MNSENTGKDIIGQTKTMKCGMQATVISDRRWDDIDIRFEDGTVVKTSRRRFKDGNVVNPNLGRGYTLLKNSVGEKNTMNCGMEATVIAYRNSDDIDIQFSDGTIVRNKKISNFRKGLIKNPSINATSICGVQQTMSCGMLCVVIEDRGCNDIDVQFADGTIVRGVSRRHFWDRKIANPSLGKLYTRTVNTSILGQTRLMKCGMEATVICDRGAKDIDVRFSDGTIITNARRGNFLRDKIDNPNYDKTSILGETRMMRNCQEATVIEDRGWNDIDVRFEDGTIIKHIYRSQFNSGVIGNPFVPTNSLPEMLIYRCIHKYYPNSRRGYRPSWLKNPNTGMCLEIDIWIPERRIGIEYDGYPWHKEENERSIMKYNLLRESQEIDKIITVLEKNTIVHESNKHINYQLSYISRRNEYIQLLQELKIVMMEIFNYLGIEGDVSIVDDAIRDFNNEIIKST